MELPSKASTGTQSLDSARRESGSVQFIQTRRGLERRKGVLPPLVWGRGTIEWMGQHNCIFIGRCFPIWIRFPPPVILYVFGWWLGKEREDFTNQDQKDLRCANVAFVTVYPDHTWGWWRGWRSSLGPNDSSSRSSGREIIHGTMVIVVESKGGGFCEGFNREPSGPGLFGGHPSCKSQEWIRGGLWNGLQFNLLFMFRMFYNHLYSLLTRRGTTTMRFMWGNNNNNN